MRFLKLRKFGGVSLIDHNIWASEVVVVELGDYGLKFGGIEHAGLTAFVPNQDVGSIFANWRHKVTADQ
jgi:hypothetical protein